jgi:predicted ferric reductase
MARAWPGGPAAFELHQYVSLLGLGFGLFHGLILTGDQYMQLSIFNVLVPFTVHDYRPVWVGLGQVSLYAWALLVGSFYVRKRIGTRTWRMIHFSSFIVFVIALAHGLGSGTDSSAPPVQWLYWAAGASLLFLLYYRILVTVGTRRAARKSNQG